MIFLRLILIAMLFLYSTGDVFDTFDQITTNDTFSSNETITISTESTSSSMSVTTQAKDSMISLVDQLNIYHNGKILTRIKQCDSNLRLNDLCETYSIDNETNSVIRQSTIHFLTFDDLFDSLLNRSIVEKFNRSCLTNNDCSVNLSTNDIQLTNTVIQNRGQSFCSIEQCQPRLTMFIDSCPTLSNPVRRICLRWFDTFIFVSFRISVDQRSNYHPCYVDSTMNHPIPIQLNVSKGLSIFYIYSMHLLLNLK